MHLRVLDPARVSNSFKHFDFKKSFTTYRGIMHNAFASPLLIPLHLIFFRSRPPFLTAPPKKMAGPSRSGSVPSGSGSGWQHHFEMLINVSRGLWNSKNVRWAFRCVIHQTCCWSPGALFVHGPSCTCPSCPPCRSASLWSPAVPPDKSVLS